MYEGNKHFNIFIFHPTGQLYSNESFQKEEEDVSILKTVLSFTLKELIATAPIALGEVMLTFLTHNNIIFKKE